MGSKAVRNLVLCLVVRGLFPAQDVFSLEFFWESSLRRAATARCLAEWLRIPNTDEIFTIGLCQDIGVLVHLQQEPALASSLEAARGETSAARLKVEEQHDGQRHDDLAYDLLVEWKFPEDLAIPIRYHHRTGAAPKQHATRARLAHAAEAVADLFEVTDKHNAIIYARSATRAAGMASMMDLKPLMDQVTEVVTEASEMLQISVGEQPGYDEIVELALKGLEATGYSLEQANALLDEALAD